MRLFIAVPIPQSIIELADTIITDLKREDWPVRWIQPGNAHITLHFLGQVKPEQSELLRIALRQPVSTHAGFDLRTANLGVFPNLRRPRVLWLGLYGPAHRLQALHADIATVLGALEFESEQGEFHTHITLGRLRNDRQSTRTVPERIRARFDAISADGIVSDKRPVPLPVREVQLIRSHIRTGGVRYEILDRFPLGEAIS